MRFLLMMFTAVALWVTPVPAQMMLPVTGDTTEENASTPSLPEPLTEEAINALVSRMSESEVRALLLDQLNRSAAPEADPAQQTTFADFIARASTGATSAVTEAVLRLPLLWSSQRQSFVNFHEKLGWGGIARFVGLLLVAIAIGFAVEKLVNALTARRFGQRLSQVSPQTLRDQFRFLAFRLLVDLLGLVAFFLVTRLMILNLVSAELLPLAEVIMINMVVFPRIGIAFGKFILAPHKPEFRIVHTDDASARRLYRQQAILLLLMGFSIAIVAFNDFNGVPMGTSRLGFWLNLSVHLYVIWIAWRNWHGLVMMAQGNDPDATRLERRMAHLYPGAVIAISVAMWIVVNILVSFGQFALLQQAPHYITMFLLALGPFFDTVLRGLVRHLTPPMSGDGMVAERAYLSTKRSYIRIGRVIIFGLVIMEVAAVWGIEFRNLAAAGVGAQVAAAIFEVLFILAIGYLVWELVSLYVNRKLAAEQTAMGDLAEAGDEGGAGGSRLSTVLPLTLSVAKAAIAVIFGLLALGNVGIDITPLLAGAGIIGLAIGFGAQKLVADIVSGVFFLVDDAFRTGEYVEVDGTMGTVEKISVRSMQLRHHRGPVHTIPYGEIPKLTNYSRDWVIMKLKFTVPFDTDPNQVKKIFKKIGNDMIAEEAWKDDFLQPFKSQGVFDFDDVGMIIRGKFMAKPGKQFMARKEIYNRVKAAFAEAGIDFARREVRVAIPGLDGQEDLSEDQKAAVAGAAGDIARQQIEDQQKP